MHTYIHVWYISEREGWQCGIKIERGTTYARILRCKNRNVKTDSFSPEK